MIHSYTDAINLLRMLALQDHEVADFFVGEEANLLNAQRSAIEYPYIWVEFADPSFSDNQAGAVTRTYDCQIYFVCHPASDSHVHEEQALQQGEDIATRFLLRLRALNTQRLIDFRLSGKLMRVQVAQLDNNWGWEMRFNLGSFLPQPCTDHFAKKCVAAYTVACVLPPVPVTLTLTLNGDVYTQDWDGVCTGDSLCQALERLAGSINAGASGVVASTFGNYLFVRSTATDTPIVALAGAGGWMQQWAELFCSIGIGIGFMTIGSTFTLA